MLVVVMPRDSMGRLGMARLGSRNQPKSASGVGVRALHPPTSLSNQPRRYHCGRGDEKYNQSAAPCEWRGVSHRLFSV